MKNVLPRKMEVTIKTLTPLWTGGVDAGKCDRIHETGILGSLRWWMEVLVRGMGGNVCDPTEQKCSSKNRLCEVCKIFGAEGQKRRFRLEVIHDNTRPDKAVLSKIELQPYQYQYRDKQDQEKTGTRTPTWYFPKNEEYKPRSGTFTIQIQSLHPNFKPEIIGGLIQFVADWAALGARSQMGFGVIQVEGSRIDTQPLYDWLMTTAGSHTYPDLPSLQNIFLSQIQPKDANSVFNEKDTFNLKYDLRQLFRTKTGKLDNLKSLRHFIMGAAPDDKQGSKAEDDRNAAKVKTSRPYPHDNSKLMRVWGWIPAQAEVYKNDWDREKIVNVIYNHLQEAYTLHEWHEMKSARDTVAPNESNAQSFLRRLLSVEDCDGVGQP